MAFFRKRKFSGSSMTRRVRRRFGRRRRPMFKRRRVVTYSSNSIRPVDGIGFRKRRIKASRYRRMLFNSTNFKNHYRSIASNGFIIPTPNDITTGGVNWFSAWPDGAPFWTAAGGAQPIDTGIAVPTFGREVFLRGGMIRCTVANPSPDISTGGSESIRVRVFAVRTIKNPNTAWLGAALPTQVQSQLWDPSVVPDFDRFGKVLFEREFDLPPNNSAMDVCMRLRPQRIDELEDSLSGNKIVWVVLVGQLTNTEAVNAVENVTVTVSHNLSFAADST